MMKPKKGHIARKGNRWYTVIDIGPDRNTGKRRQKWISGYRTKREAQEGLNEALAQLARGTFVVPSHETIAEMCRNYLDTTCRTRVRPITIQNYRFLLEKYLVSQVGHKRASDLTGDDLNRIMADMLDTGKSSTTCHNLLRVLHRVLDDACRKGKLSRNMADLADPPPKNTPERNTWDPPEYTIFFEAAQGSEYYDLFHLLAATGARRSEGIGSKWLDFNLEGDEPAWEIQRTAYKLETGEWRIEAPKTARSHRTIALPQPVVLRLRHRREQMEADAEWAGQSLNENSFVFQRTDGTLPDPRHVSKVFRRIVQQAGLKPTRLHDFRHSYATLLRKAGVPIEVISVALGHASTVVTQLIYNHWQGESQQVAETVDRLLTDALNK